MACKLCSAGVEHTIKDHLKAVAAGHAKK